ncbi:MAG: hypothetical protein WDN48_19375 [Pseudolabrys sp.]
MTDVLELHDRQNFEIFAYYCGIDRTDDTQQRIMKAVDHWIDINGLNDDQAAAKIAADGIDILIDLNGYTKDARTKVFARRPAPIAVNWFGYPGTMASPYHHYLIADPFIVPPDLEAYYSERVVHLPCYQPNDRHRLVAERRPSRAEAGLPEDAFNAENHAEYVPPLDDNPDAHAPGSVLWLLTGTNDSNARLRKAAGDHGISPDRLVFAREAAQPRTLGALSLGGSVPRQRALWRPHHRRRVHCG